MFDDDVQAPLSLGASDRYYRVAKFPTRNIKTPIVLVYGGSDSLVDIRVMLKELPRHTVAKEVPHFEHLDFLWGQEVERLVFPHVFDALSEYAGRDHLKSPELTYKSNGNRRLAINRYSGCPGDELSSNTIGDLSDSHLEVNSCSARQDTSLAKASPRRFSPTTFRNRKYVSPPSSSSTEQTSASMDGPGDRRIGAQSKTRTSILGNSIKHTRERSGSVSSTRSVDSVKRFGEGGISIGTSKATTGFSK